MPIDPASPPDEALANPYASPGADLVSSGLDLDGDLAEAEAMRRAHLGHEVAVKLVGSISVVISFFVGVIAVFIFLSAFGVIQAVIGGPRAAQTFEVGAAVTGGYFALIASLNLAVGVGLRRLQPWARWTTVVFLGISLAGILLNLLVAALMGASTDVTIGAGITLLLAGGINGYLFYLMIAPRSSMIFSCDYKSIIARTTYIKGRASIIVVVLLIVLLVVSVAIASAELLDGLMNR